MSFRFLHLLLLGLVFSLAISLPRTALAEDSLEDEEDVQIELDEAKPASQPAEEAAEPGSTAAQAGEEEEEQPLKPSPDAETTLLFTKPASPQGHPSELPAGKDVHLLVGFSHKGSTDSPFIIETLEASLRYTLDFSFYIQNFSTVGYEQTVKPKQQATLHYNFYPAEGFSSRPFGLVVNLRYRDGAGRQYQEAVFNETVTIVEVDEGLDGETFFLYLLLGAVAVLALLGGHHLFSSYIWKRKGSGSSHHHAPSSSKQPKVEMGTQNHNDVDYDWLPPETLNEINKSPKVKQSPRQRKNPRNKAATRE